jgi:dolichol-phosphate mannosyltransferase
MAAISVVVPVFNEENCIEMLLERLQAVAESGADTYEYIFVDDGSTDGSLSILRELAQRYPNVKYLSFTRNFGHEVATTAGLDHASGDAVLLIDADLQDPPEVIQQLLEKWRQSYQIVYAQRRLRSGENFLKKATSRLFYRIIRLLSNVKIPLDTGDFRLMDRCVVEQFRRCREQNRFVRGLVAWTGFKQTAVIYDRDHRYAGKTKYNMIKLIVLALDAVIGFSNLPLRVGVFAGLLVCMCCFFEVIYIVIQKMFFGIPIRGYALIVTGIFFLGGIQLWIIGLIGEYIGRIYRQTQQRPLYITAEKSKTLPQGPEGLYKSNE